MNNLAQMGYVRLDTDTALSNEIAQKYYEKNGFKRKGLTISIIWINNRNGYIRF